MCHASDLSMCHFMAMCKNLLEQEDEKKVTLETDTFRCAYPLTLCFIASSIQRTFDLNFNSKIRRDHGTNFL